MRGEHQLVMRHIGLQLKDRAGLQVLGVAIHGQPHLAAGENGVHAKGVGVGV
jgi:hypothetical protein